jgi:hypothetical protein
MLISNRCRHRAPNLTSLDRFVLGLTTLFISPQRIAKLAAILRPVTLLKFQKALVDQKYRLLFLPSATRCKPGPKRPSAELIAAIVELKSRNPKFGYLRIAQQISHAFGVDIDKDVVRRVLAKHYLSSAIIGSTAFPLTDLGMAVASSERDRCCPDSLPLLGGPPPLTALSVRRGRSLAAENLFLRRQLALYKKRGIKPRRIDAATRMSNGPPLQAVQLA